MPTRNILDAFDVSLDFLSQVVFDNPSLRGMIVGYLAEAKLREILTSQGKATNFDKHDDHDRTKKGDLVLKYRAIDWKIEVKLLDTNEVKLLVPSPNDAEVGRWVPKVIQQTGPGRANPEYELEWPQHGQTGRYRGKFQCNGSDKREVKFQDGTTLRTNLLQFGEFDILAVALFPFFERWEFAYALNRDLPQSRGRDYTPEQRAKLILSGISITWPLPQPFTTDLYSLLDKLADDPNRTAIPPVATIVTTSSASQVPATKPKKRKKKS